MYLRGLVPGRRAVFALTIGALSGWLAALSGMPLPWMLGPMIGNTLAAVLALPVRGPDRLRPLVIPVIGVMLGSALRPEMFDTAGRYAASLALLPPFLVVTALVSYAVYRRVGRYDPVTAFFSAMPGGLNDMLILGGAAGGNESASRWPMPRGCCSSSCSSCCSTAPRSTSIPARWRAARRPRR